MKKEKRKKLKNKNMILSDLFYKKMLQVLNSRESEENNNECGENLSKKEDELFKFVVFGDPQVSNYMFARECCFFRACRDLKNIENIVDALVIVGDVTENGFKCEMRMVSHIINGISHKFSDIFLLTGNHDIRLRRYNKQHKRFCHMISEIKNGVMPESEKYYFSKDYDCCKFICLGADRGSFEAAHISEEQLHWLDNELTKAENENKISFVFNHQPLKKTHGLPDVWQSKDNWRGSIGRQSDKVKAVFDKHRNIIFITGHLHYGVWEKTFEDFGHYKCFSIPTVGAGNHGSQSFGSQGFVFTVYDDRIVAQARDCKNGKFVDEAIPNAKVVIERKNPPA